MATTLARSASRTRPYASRAAVPARLPVSRQASPGQVKPAQRREAPTAPAQTPAPIPQPPSSNAVSARTTTPAPRSAPPGFTLVKLLTVLGLAVGSLMALLFGLDLATAFPFERASLVADVGFLVSGDLLVYLSVDVLRDQRRIGLW